MKKIFILFLFLTVPAFADFANMCGVDGYSVFNAAYAPYTAQDWVTSVLDSGDTFTCAANTRRVFNATFTPNTTQDWVTSALDSGDTFTCAANTRRVFNATFTPSTYTCAEGYYLPANSDGCVACPAGYYCSGGTFTFNETVTQGTVTACPIGTYLATTGGTSINDCTACTGATYNDTTGAAACKSCPTGYDYNTDAGKISETDCQIHCDGGKWSGEYTQLEYIESTGTQYIDTFITPTSDFVFYLDGMILGGSTYRVCGTSNESITVESYSNNIFASKINGRSYNGGITFGGVNNRFRIGLSPHGQVHYDGTEKTNERPYTPSGTLTLFGTTPNSQKAVARIYGAELYDGNTLTFDGIPVRRNGDGVLGMYDKLTNTFYPNSGTGTFTAGPDIDGIGGSCVDVGAGYYAAASTVNYGSVGTRTACPAGLTTVGYGHGADEVADCARTLHIGNYVLYGRGDKITTPSLNIKLPNEDIYYISLSTTNHNLSRLHLSLNGNQYTAYDDSLFYGERDFDTGEKISQ